MFRRLSPLLLNLGLAFAALAVQAAPNATITVSKGAATNLASVTAGNTGLYASVPLQAGCTYAWTITGGSITSGAGTNVISFKDTAAAGSTLTVGITVTDAALASSNSSKILTVLPLPGTAVITTAANITEGATSHAISATTIAGAMYAWQPTSGVSYTSTTVASTSYTTTVLNGMGNTSAAVLPLSCKITNPDGVYATVSRNINVWALPMTPTVVTTQNDGSTPESSLTASTPGHKAHVSAQPNTTYAWTLVDGTATAGLGTAQITFTTGITTGATAFKATCTVSNPAGGTASAFATESVISAPVSTITVVKGTATNLSSITAGNSGVYAYVPAQAGDTYTWNVTGGNITSGAGTNMIAITDTAAAGGTLSIDVTVTNSLMTSSHTVKNLAVLQLPGSALITTAANITQGPTTHSLSATAISGAVYAWQPLTGVAFGSTTAASTSYTTTLLNNSGNNSGVLLPMSCKITNPDGVYGTVTRNIYLWALPTVPVVSTVMNDGVTAETQVTALTTGHKAQISYQPHVIIAWSIVDGAVTSGQSTQTLSFSAGATPGAAALKIACKVTNPAGSSVVGSASEDVYSAPAISSFSGLHTVPSGSGSTLTAVFSGGAGSVDHGVGVVSSGVGAATGSLSSTTTFTLTVTNGIGATATATAAITVATGANSTGNLATARYLHTQTTLPNGKVLILGGNDGAGGYLNTAEIFDPQTGSFTASAGHLTTGRELHTATLLPNGKVLIAGGQGTAGNLTSCELYDYKTDSFGSTGSLAGARATHTATLMPTGKVLVAGGYNSSALSSVEIYDPQAGTFSQPVSGNLMAARRLHVAILLRTGKVLLAGGELTNGVAVTTAELYDPYTLTSALTGNLNTARYLHTGTLLSNGKVLIAGGYNNAYLSSAELYDPQAGTFTATSGSLLTGRCYHTATPMRNGFVLMAGGQNGGYLASTEFYDPAADAFLPATDLPLSRGQHSASLLPDGRILLATGVGGSPFAAYLNTAVVFDPAEPAPGTWTSTGSLQNGRELATMVLLPNGKVLVSGGMGAGNHVITSNEIYDPQTGTYTPTGDLGTTRIYHTATLLPNGKVLLAGGKDDTNSILITAEIYDPQTGACTPTGNLTRGCYFHVATLLPNGKVLITGSDQSSTGNTAQLYNPQTGTFADTGTMTVNRWLTQATLLPNGKVLVSGGRGYPSGNPIATTELYDPQTGTFAASGSMSIPREWHMAQLLPNGKVLLACGRSTSNTVLPDADLYDPVTGTCATTGSMASGHVGFASSPTASGKALVLGGDNGVTSLKTTEVYDPVMGTFTTMGDWDPGFTSYSSRALLLPNGKVLAAGGYDVTYSATSKLYQ